MFENERKVPIKILQLRALKRRMTKNHPSRQAIEKELNRREAGLWGEKEIDKKLIRINQAKFHILKDLRLPNGDGTFFQLDHIVLSIMVNLIIEGKNMVGPLYFDLDNHQFMRKDENGEMEGFTDPVSQARLHQKQLTEWLTRHKLPIPPMEFFVIISNPHTVFYVNPPNHPLAKKIFNLYGLSWEIDKLEQCYNTPKISEKELKKTINSLLKANTPPPPSEVLTQYGISVEELLTGVHCPDCEYLPLIYQTGKWYCPRCKKKFKDACRTAVEDHFLLVSDKLTNSQFRRLVHLNDQDIATKTLISLGLTAFDTTKGRYYQR